MYVYVYMIHVISGIFKPANSRQSAQNAAILSMIFIHFLPFIPLCLYLSLFLFLSVSLFQIRCKIDRMIELMHGTENLPGFAKIESKVGLKLFPHVQYTPFYL